MDILLIDPPQTILKDGSTDRGYNIGPTSLAAYLRNNGIEVAVVTGDLLLGPPTKNVLSDPLSLLVPDWLRINVQEIANRQRELERKVKDEDHIIWKNLAKIITKNSPKAVGISYLTPMEGIVRKICRMVKEINPEIKVIVGSFHPTFLPDEVMVNKDIDIIVRGEGEIPLLSLIKELKAKKPLLERVPGICYRDTTGQVQSTALPKPINNLDELPFVARDLVLDCDYNIYRNHAVITTRGCIYNCSFCADKAFWGGNNRRRSVKNVIRELKFLKDTYKKMSSLDFVDGTFTYDRKYLQDLCQTMIDENLDFNWRCTARYDNLDEPLLKLMKRAGCSALYLGLESGSERMLKEIDKKMSLEKIITVSQMVYESGIHSITSVLLGHPEEHEEDIEKTLELMKIFKTDFFDVNNYVPLAGTRLWDEMSEEEKRRIDWLKIGYKSWENDFTKYIPHDEFINYQMKAYNIANDLRKRSLTRLGIRLVINFIPRTIRRRNSN